MGLFVDTDSFSRSAKLFYIEADDPFIVSDYASAEFVSVIARMTRMGLLPKSEAQAIFGRFDTWRARSARTENVVGGDIQSATAIIRRLDLNLRAPDAINLTIALRIGASLVTFDRRMADNASALGIVVEAV